MRINCSGRGGRSAPRLHRIAITIAIGLATLPVTVNAVDELRLDEYRGKVIMLDFWASWCVPCRRSFPWMNQMQEKYAEDGLVVIAVNLDNDLDEAHDFLQHYPADFLISYDADRRLVHEYGVQVMPSSFLIDRDGNVVERHLGFKTSKAAEYEATIVAAIQSERTQ